jgi:uncharacterized membrane protein YgcG
MPSSPSEKNQLKVQGLAFGQAFQTVFKISAMYSVDHPAAGKAIQQAYDSLVEMFKVGGQFTFGFVRERLLLNTSLISQHVLTHLEVAFSKREVGAVNFQPGVTLNNFKRALALITTRPTVIAERGGIKKFLAENLIEGIRIMPAAKREEDGDTIDIGMDIQSYLTAQAILGQEAPSDMMALDMLLQASGIAKPPAGFASNPRDVLEVAETATRNTLADPEGNLAELLTALTQMLAGLRPDYLVSSLPPEKQPDFQGNSPGVMATHLMEDAIAGWAVERLASSTSGGGPGGGAGGGLAASTSGGGSGGGAGGGLATSTSAGGPVGGEVLHALLRGLKATHVAERLLQKLAEFVKQANLPPEVYDRLRREVLWFTLPEEEKEAQLLRMDRFTEQDFDRVLHYIQEAVNDGRFDEAAGVAWHYFAVLDKAPAATRTEGLRRAPQLLHSLASVQTLESMRALVEPLVKDLLDETRLHWPTHLEITNCLIVVAEDAGRFEDFELVCKIATDLKLSLTRHPAQHADCCGGALSRLLPVEVLDRLIELYLQRRGDAAWVRTATSLLVMIGPLGAEAVFRRLEEEPAASNRLPLIRLIRNLGTPAIEATRKRLADDRWYVVRNAAIILGDLGDPELPAQLRGALRYPEPRVQQAAITAILRSTASGRGEALAEALPNLQAGVLEMALDELTVLKDPASLDHLEALIIKKDFKVGALEKAVIALAAIPSDRAAEVLYRILTDTGQALLVRRTALGGLYNHPSAAAARLVAKFTDLPAGDRLSVELNKPTERPAD